MKNSVLFKVFTFFIAAQFLNVQIQTAYGTEAITHANPELIHALKEMEAKVQTRIENMSERAQLHYAYRLYKIDVKLRNKTFHKSDADIQQRIEDLNSNKIPKQEESTSTEDQELSQELSSEQAFHDLAGAQKIKISLNRTQIKKEQLLQNTDPVLLDLGSVQNENGTFSKASFQTFQGKVFELNKTLESRAPSSINIIVKVILSLLIVAAGLSILFFVYAVFALATAFASGITPLGYTVLILLTVGSISGMYFGLKALFSSKANTRLVEVLEFA